MTQEKKKRPGTVTVIGILAVIFCSIGLMFSVFDVIMRLSGGSEYMLSGYKSLQTQSTADMFNVMIAVLNRYKTVMLLSAILLLLIRGTGLAAGILLLSAKSVGRKLLNGYAAACIFHLIFSTAWGLMYFREMADLMNTLVFRAGSPMSGASIVSVMKVSMYAGLVIGVIFGAAWPVIVLIFMNKKRVKEYAA